MIYLSAKGTTHAVCDNGTATRCGRSIERYRLRPLAGDPLKVTCDTCLKREKAAKVDGMKQDPLHGKIGFTYGSDRSSRGRTWRSARSLNSRAR